MHKINFLKYLEFEKRYSKHTILSYSTDLTQFLLFILKEYKISDISEVNHHIIRSWIASLIENKISTRTVNRKITTLKSFFKYLLQEDTVQENPTQKVISPKNQKKLPIFIEKSKMIELLSDIEFPDSMQGERDKLIIDVFYMTGMRLSELLRIKKSDINFSSSFIKVLGKRNKERILPITLNLSKKINSFYVKYKIENYLFVNDKGKNLSSKKVYNIVNKYLGKVTSIDKKSPHVLRHTFATHMLNSGADLNAIKEILGHTNLSATQIYTHNTIDKLKTVYKQAHPRA